MKCGACQHKLSYTRAFIRFGLRNREKTDSRRFNAQTIQGSSMNTNQTAHLFTRRVYEKIVTDLMSLSHTESRLEEYDKAVECWQTSKKEDTTTSFASTYRRTLP